MSLFCWNSSFSRSLHHDSHVRVIRRSHIQREIVWRPRIQRTVCWFECSLLIDRWIWTIYGPSDLQRICAETVKAVEPSDWPGCLPPHTTHYLQLLDVGCFGPLDKTYRKQLDKRNKTGVVHINKLEFFAFLKKAMEDIMTETTIRSAWAKSRYNSVEMYIILLGVC